MNKIADNLQKVRNNIASACARCGRDSSEITLVVVTKSANFDAVKQVARLGCSELGENRVQHLKVAADDIEVFLQQNPDDPALPKKINWHMIGHLQRNKVRQLLRASQIIHSVDTLRLAEEISRNAEKLDICPKILMQVNCSQEPQKYGVPVGAAVHLAEQIVTMPNLKLIGLMTMGPLTLNKDIAKACFARAHELFEEIRGEKIGGPDFKHLSMGMSQDYEIAIENGATILRIGSSIFA
ncbi:MAG: YggS family pyridoxal phosphate-dependent enzyme [Planctomycetes bacterium]|nr:YggS family pyridoxal phosphate-dependent enzyme [Planctomycetota bacterium]MBU1517527.1 YggS family pyridoxal phosphate-dependent enzyme [Planctomycetota bacterium]MBU2457327.1 YggS family pyridoxal phosphate-dependent enzyme [Planctomycetota bacterium]MBU2597269.1 YggS family pyridoxal phosphate-dependent enzyme [Planctomycetota bacterium]